MSKQEIWPPPPTTPDPAASHDEFLTAVVCAPTTKQHLSRMLLYRDLRKVSGLPLRQCAVLVNSYCDRNEIFQTKGSPFRWLGSVAPLIILVTAVIPMVTQSSLLRSWHAATTTAARHAINVQEHNLASVCLDIVVVGVCATLILPPLFTLQLIKQARRDAADARVKMLSRAARE